MACAHPRPQFSVDEWVLMVLKYTETDSILKTIRRFQKQFPNRNVRYYRRSCPNLNHTAHAIVIVHYCLSVQCPLIRKLPLKPDDCFQNNTGFCIL